MVRGIANTSLHTDGTIDAISGGDLDGVSVADAITKAIATIGENMTLRRAAVLEVSKALLPPTSTTLLPKPRQDRCAGCAGILG